MSLPPFGFRSCYAVGAKLCVPAISFFLVTQSFTQVGCCWHPFTEPTAAPQPEAQPRHTALYREAGCAQNPLLWRPEIITRPAPH